MKGVMLMAYGTPKSLEDVEAYYTHIRGGRKPSEEQLDDLVGRYRAIGGTSPLIKITELQRSKLESRIRDAGSDIRVYAGMKHSPPFIADVVGRARDDGVDEMLGLSLAPHYASMSIGSYIAAVKQANERLDAPMKLEFVMSWHDNPALISMWAELVNDAAIKIGGRYSLVCSAHSLPARIIAEGDPYRDELRKTSELVARKTLDEGWSFCFQSASHTGEPWLGPDILDHLRSLYENGERSFVIAPLGFVSDHLEILYDIDVECRRWANDAGVRLERCASPNDSERFVDCLLSVADQTGFLQS